MFNSSVISARICLGTMDRNIRDKEGMRNAAIKAMTLSVNSHIAQAVTAYWALHDLHGWQ